MNVYFSKRFEKQLDGIRDDELKRLIANAVKSVMEAKTVSDIPNIKNLKPHKKAYRIRIGDYRIGLFILGANAGFMDFDHRGKIYKRFP